VDPNPTKVAMINRGESPIIEEGIAELIKEVVESRHLRATADPDDAVAQSEISLVCVGTPSNSNGSLDLRYVKSVCKEIGSALEKKSSSHIVVIRSTMLPGTVQEIVIPTLEVYSGKKVGREIQVCINPEFLREGTSIRDFYSPPFTLIGADDEEVTMQVRRLYAGIEAPLFTTSIKASEMVKYACNCFHGLKVTFANEIGNICKALGIDSHQVMEVFCEDRKLNLSPYYLKPGFAFGGSCLPKDLRAISYKAKELDVEVPVLSAILASNQKQIDIAVEMVKETGQKRVGVLGFSFKAGTDDLRESPMVELIETLIGKGYSLSLYDSDVSLAKLMGANKEYIEREIPHISGLMCQSAAQVADASDVIIIGNKADEFRAVLESLRPDQTVIDLVRLFGGRQSDDRYLGICW